MLHHVLQLNLMSSQWQLTTAASPLLLLLRLLHPRLTTTKHPIKDTRQLLIHFYYKSVYCIQYFDSCKG